MLIRTQRLTVTVLVGLFMLSLLIAGTVYLNLGNNSSGLLEISPTTIPVSTPYDLEPSNLINHLSLWAPDILWQDANPTTMDNGKGSPISGVSRSGTGISLDSLVPDIHPKINEELIKLGWQLSGQADAPGGSSYHYTIFEQGKERVIDIYYKTKSPIVSREGEPLKFRECPCPYEITISYSDPF